jgi:hypothetical protein
MWKTGIVAAVTAAGALLLAPAASQAIPFTDQVTCTFSGASRNMDDIPGIEYSEQLGGRGDAQDDAEQTLAGNFTGPNDSGNGVIEHGLYAFEAPYPNFGPIPTECVHIDIDGSLVLDPDGKDNTGVYPAAITAEGFYDSYLCGTEVTSGDAVVDINNGAGSGALGATETELDRLALPYTIVFASYDGPLVASSSQATGVAGNPNPPSRSAVVTGEAHLEPVYNYHGSACIDADATDFYMLGAFQVTTTS